MKRTAKYALSAVLTAAFVVPVFAQSDTPFPDTKENHWAYEAVTRLKADGILVGYPNGMFIGNRLATRYEMAVAINAAYTKLKNITDGLSKQIDDINGKITELQNRPVGPSQADFDALKAALNDVKDQVAAMRSYGQDIADLKRLAEKFEKDLAALGVDVDDLKKSLNALDKRVGVLEAHRLPIDIHGDINFMSMSGYGTSSSYGVDVTGRPEGVGHGANAADATSANTLYHELGFDITTNNEKGPKGEVVAVISNMLDNASTGPFVSAAGYNLGAFSSMSTGSAPNGYAPGGESVYIQKAVASFGSENSGLPFSGQVGRIGLKLGSYILERTDFNPYYDNARWSNGEWSVDGAKVGIKLGPVRLHLFAAEASDATDSQGTVIQPMFAGPQAISGPAGTAQTLPAALSTAMEVNQLAGAHLWVPIGKDGNIDLSYVLLQANTPAANGANNMQDYGADLNYKFGNALKVWGGYSKTDTSAGTHNINNKNDQRATGYLGYEASNWGLSGGYKYIDGLFAAPGSWGRIGTWWNPTGIEGFDGAGHIDFAKAFTLKATGEYYVGTGLSKMGLSTSTKITRVTGDLGYKFGSGVGVDFGAEDVTVTGLGGPTPQQLWINLGASYDFSDNAKFSVLWQISDLTNQSFATGAPGNAFNNWGATNNRGGLITTQFSIKF